MNNWKKGIASWKVGKTLYLSVPFTWLLEDAQRMADEWKGKTIIGGPALMEPNECEGFEPLLFHNPCATFTTRGCPNHCKFCAVPKLEPEFKEIPDFRPAPIVCDNNLLAASKLHIWRVVDKLKVFPKVDFNQGLEAKRFAYDIAGKLGELNCKVRFAFDHINDEGPLKDAIDLCRERTTRDIGVYCLIGFDDTPEDALYRLEKVREWGALPNPMRYQPLTATKKNEYVGDAWTEKELQKAMKYYSRLNWLGHVPYDNFRETGQMEMFI